MDDDAEELISWMINGANGVMKSIRVTRRAHKPEKAIQ